MVLKNRIILEEYRKCRDDYVAIGDIVSEKLHTMTEEAGIAIMAIEHRVKQEKSLEGKLEVKGQRYNSIEDITDILGARVICYFADDVDRIGKLVEQGFSIDWDNSQDKRKLLDDNSFGYLSLHYICSLKPSDEYPEDYCRKKFEIQIRTNLQHTWAQIEHDMGYKSEFGVPSAVIRNFSRIAGLLEVADDEFMRARDAMIEYTEGIRKKIIDNEADDVRIDIISLEEYIKHNTRMQEFLGELSKISGAEISYVDSESYVEQLAWLKITELGGLQKLLDQNHDRAISMAKKALENGDFDIVSSTVGLRYLCRAELIRGGYTEDQITDFLKISLGNEERARRQARYLLRSASRDNGNKDE